MNRLMQSLFLLTMTLAFYSQLRAEDKMTIHLFQPEWQQANLRFRENPQEVFLSRPMRSTDDGWWEVQLAESKIEFSFFDDANKRIDLGGVLGCYENDHYSCEHDNEPPQNFRSSAIEIWVKNGVVFIYHPDDINKTKSVFSVLTLNLHTYQEFKTLKEPESALTESDINHHISKHGKLFDSIADAISQLDPDAICFQEVGEWKSSDDTLNFGRHPSNATLQILQRVGKGRYHSYMDWSHYGWGIWKEGSALLSKYPIVKQASRYISHSNQESKTFWKSRNIPYIQIEVPKFGKIDLFSVHAGWWDDKDEPFKLQFQRLTQWINEISVSNNTSILCGDFNQPAKADGYQLMIGNSGFSDQYAKANPNGMDDATIGSNIAGWEGNQKGERVDYILLNDNSSLKVRQSQRIFTEKVFGRVSDHVGIYTQFTKH